MRKIVDSKALEGQASGLDGPEAPVLCLCHVLGCALLYGGLTSLVAAKWLGRLHTSQAYVQYPE